MRDSVPSTRYSPICNVLRQWKTSVIPTYRVGRLYDKTFLAITLSLKCLYIFRGLDARGSKNYEQAHTHTRDIHSNDNNNESTEVQTLGAIRIQLYHQCFEQVWQRNFTSFIGLRRSTQRHRSSKVAHRSSIFEVDTSIFEGRHIDHRSSKVDTSIFED